MSDPILCVMSEWSSSTRCPCGGYYKYDRGKAAGQYSRWMKAHKQHSNGTLRTTYDGSWGKVYASRPEDTVEEIPDA